MAAANGGDYGFAILVILAMIWFWGSGSSFSTTSVRVTELLCDRAWKGWGECDGSSRSGSDLYFRLNPSSRAAQVIVKTNSENSPGFLYTSILKDCAIVDDDNLECVRNFGSSHETVGMSEGKYFRSCLDGSGWDVRGASGWRYWLHKLRSL